jgi:hypothetical protein
MQPKILKSTAAVKLDGQCFPLPQVGHIRLEQLVSDRELLTNLENIAKKVGREADINLIYRTTPEALQSLGVSKAIQDKVQGIRSALGIEGQFFSIDPHNWGAKEIYLLRQKLKALARRIKLSTAVGLAQSSSPVRSKSSAVGRERTEEAQRRKRWEQAKNPLIPMIKIDRLLKSEEVRSVEEAASKLGLSATGAHMLDKLKQRLHPEILELLDPAVGFDKWLAAGTAFEQLGFLSHEQQLLIVRGLLAEHKILTPKNLRLATRALCSINEKRNGHSPADNGLDQIRLGLERIAGLEINQIEPESLDRLKREIPVLAEQLSKIKLRLE